jgi:hypothetical protein
LQGKAHSIARTCSGKPDPKGNAQTTICKNCF